MTVAAMIRETLATRGEAIALTTSSETWTFTQLAEAADAWHRFLDQLQAGPGERIALALGNGPELVIAHIGNLLSGRMTVPMNPRQTASEMQGLLKDAEPALVLVDETSEANMREACRALNHSPHILIRRFFRSALSGGTRSPETSPVELLDETPAMLPYTSGTTGAPKGAILTQGSLAAAAGSLREAWQFTDDDHLYLTLPLFHVHGLGVGIHGMLTAGYRVTLRERFHSRDALAELADPSAGYTAFFGVPTYYHRLLEVEDHRSLEHLRLCVCGSAPLSAETHRRFRERFGIDILERYGMSETLMNLSNKLTGPRIPGSVGAPLPGVSIRIMKNEQEASPGEEGEIQIRGRNVCAGYWRNDEATRAAFTHDGWFRSGDAGVFDEKTCSYRITGRLKELIISGGYNIHPREVEEVVAQCPGIVAAAVAGLPDEDFGEVVAAYVVGDTPDDDLRAFCRERLSAYKIPRCIVRVDQLPRNALGKVQRNRLGEMAP